MTQQVTFTELLWLRRHLVHVAVVDAPGMFRSRYDLRQFKPHRVEITYWQGSGHNVWQLQSVDVIGQVQLRSGGFAGMLYTRLLVPSDRDFYPAHWPSWLDEVIASKYPRQ